MVSESKNIFTCFGCGKSGDSITFIQAYKQCDFNEALEILANDFSITNFMQNNAENSYKENVELLEKVNNFYKQSLKNHPKLLQYLRERKLEGEDLQKYDIGFASTQQNLIQAFSQDALEKAGILVRYGNTLSYPARERLIFGIRNAQHKIVAFVSRTHPFAKFNQNAPKYINSKESKIYQKRELLYMFSNAKSSINKEKKALVVEGYIDCITFHKIGFSHCVATGGTAFSKEHLQALTRNNAECKIIFCFDNDKSGMEANFRALQLCFNAQFFNLEVAILLNKNKSGARAKDINEIVSAGDTPNIKYYPASEFFIKMLYKKYAPEIAFNRAKEEIEKIENFHIKNEFAQMLLNLSGAPREALQIKGNIIPPTLPLPKDILKTLIFSARAREVYKSYFEIKDKILQEIYTQKLDKIKFLLTDETKTLDSKKFDFFIFEKKRVELLRALQNAAIKKDKNAIFSLTRQIKEIKQKLEYFSATQATPPLDTTSLPLQDTQKQNFVIEIIEL